MLLFSTLLSVKDTITKDGFIKLVIDWNQNSRFKENVISGIEWHGEHNARYGNDQLWLDIQEYRNGNTVAVRFEKTDKDGVVWDTDFVMNFQEMQLSVLLYQGHLENALTFDSRFSTPNLITLLSNGGYLKDDGDLPVTPNPIFIKNNNLSMLCNVVNASKRYRLPVVYISKNYDQTDPVNVRKLANRLKGAAHVLVQENHYTNHDIRIMCNDRNEYNGAVGIYFPNQAVEHRRFFYRSYQGYDELMMERVVRTVISYANMQMIKPLYTWQGVNNAILSDRLSNRCGDLIAPDQAKKRAESKWRLEEQKCDKGDQLKIEVHNPADATDEEIAQMRRQIEELTHENERLTAENTGLRTQLNGI